MLCFNSLQTGKCIQSEFLGCNAFGKSVFQFPSNGKVYSKWQQQLLTLSGARFNSLQTGKCIQSLRNPLTPYFPARTVFQFPSNGKVYSKGDALARTRERIEKFQFPSNGKVYSKIEKAENFANKEAEFQFPSNGKVYSKIQKNFHFQFFMSFNSLQTGKCIQSESFVPGAEDGGTVSIPFKRESVFKVMTGKQVLLNIDTPFQFPSNGKVYSKASEKG